jgi:hypothetical protein
VLFGFDEVLERGLRECFYFRPGGFQNILWYALGESDRVGTDVRVFFPFRSVLILLAFHVSGLP